MSRKRETRPERKVCRMCGREFPNTHDYFEWSHRDLGYLQTFCRECSSERGRQKYERIKQNPERYEAMLAAKREYENVKARENGVPEWKPKEVYSNSFSARRARERSKEDELWAYQNKLRRALRHCVMSKGKNTVRNSCLTPIVGIPVRDLHYYLLDTFKQIYGYEWDGVEPTHVDHIIPLSTENTREGKERLFHYTNLRLIKETDNRAKGRKLDYEIRVN